MIKKLICLLALAVIICVSLVGCSLKSKTVHCDNCGKEVSVSADSKMDDSWIIYCEDCEKELGLDEVVSSH